MRAALRWLLALVVAAATFVVLAMAIFFALGLLGVNVAPLGIFMILGGGMTVAAGLAICIGVKMLLAVRWNTAGAVFAVAFVLFGSVDVGYSAMTSTFGPCDLAELAAAFGGPLFAYRALRRLNVRALDNAPS